MKKVLVAANDPGGANAIAPVVRALLAQENDVRAYLTGPALDVFASNHLPYTDVSAWTAEELSLHVAEYAPGIFLAGTSGGMSVDKRIIDIIGRTIPSVYVLDFWNSYTERFSKEGTDLAYLPTMICVMDERAQIEMIEAGIPKDHITVTGNPYFEHFTDGITTDEEDVHQILFVSQPISSMPEHSSGFTEFQVIEGIKTALMMMPSEYYLSIRLHPRDDAHKYDEYIGSRVSLSMESTLENALSKAGCVVGMFSPVLMQAALAGKRVYRYIPASTETFSHEFGDMVPLTTRPEELADVVLHHIQKGPEKSSGWIVPHATKHITEVLGEL